jgi:hypothetical protein
VERKAPKPAARAAHPAPAHRTARVVRVRRTATAAASQPAYQYSQTTYAQPTYAQPTYRSRPTIGPMAPAKLHKPPSASRSSDIAW